MDLMTSMLGNEQLQTVLMGIIGLILTNIINRAAGAFTAATGIQIEARHREALHEAIKSGVQSGLQHGPKVAFETLKVHVVQHLRQSVPDALKALAPDSEVIDALIDRYTRAALSRVGEPH
jgi:hypothetical protein